MRRILTTAGDSILEMGHIVALLALFIYIFALVGMKLFSSKFWFEEGGVSAPWDEVGGCLFMPTESHLFQPLAWCIKQMGDAEPENRFSGVRKSHPPN